MQSVEVLVIPRLPDRALAQIANVERRVKIADAGGWFDVEIRATWPQWTVDRYLGARKYPATTLEERNRALAAAEVVLLGWPPLKDLKARARRLKWVHALPAGASNFFDTDLWGSDVLVTTSRGFTNRRPMAEYVLASFLHFARGLNFSYRDQRRRLFDHQSYDPVLLRDKTACVVGAGGIGQEVGKLCAAAGMRVVGTRRSVTTEAAPPAGFARLEAPRALYDLLRESEFVAICCPWTKETTKLIGREAFAAMRPGTVLVNISRGEIVDEEALLDALAAGKLRGVALDVYVGEFERPPDARLWDDERVLITPHVSAGTDVSEHGGVGLFCANLDRYLKGHPLENVIDWERGY
ncbi:MAG: D-2-hydroxyacid dehydrogenase [Deltaproteobacteria bacterium]|nr:D-2-hydroxyacid dehydrogenase [Deltaproteobacteria bacterium]